MEKFEKIIYTIIFVIALGMFLSLVGKFMYAYHLGDEDAMWVSFMMICVVTCLWVFMTTITYFIAKVWTSKE